VKVLTLDKNSLTELAFTGASQLEVLSAGHNQIEKIGTSY
jgi:hypothetical protein